MRIWTYKNADEKAHTFSRRSKNVKKRTKTYEKRILCKFTFSGFDQASYALYQHAFEDVRALRQTTSSVVVAVFYHFITTLCDNVLCKLKAVNHPANSSGLQ